MVKEVALVSARTENGRKRNAQKGIYGFGNNNIERQTKK